jgi:acyl-CoA thioesterase YciA
VAAHQHAAGRLVTVAMREVVFHHPVFVGDLVSFYAETAKVGNTSVTVRVEVEAMRAGAGGLTRSRERVKVTEAEVVYVHVDAAGKPTPIGADQGSQR